MGLCKVEPDGANAERGRCAFIPRPLMDKRYVKVAVMPPHLLSCCSREE